MLIYRVLTLASHVLMLASRVFATHPFQSPTASWNITYHECVVHGGWAQVLYEARDERKKNCPSSANYHQLSQVNKIFL
jgi:hypothetical protein